jgi:hypothetical protein
VRLKWLLITTKIDADNKAAQQKIEAANREHPICIENKHGNIVIDFSAAAYEYFKHALLETLHTSSQYFMILFSSINPDLSLSLLRIHGSIDVRKRC